MRTLRILDAAIEDLLVGIRFYEAQADGVGQSFFRSVSSDIESLRTTAGVHPVVFGRYHRKLASRFPWAIYYQYSETEIRVHAVLDCRSDPAFIERRFSSR